MSLKKLILILLFLTNISYANDIAIYNFDELINSNPSSGDILNIRNNLTSDESINNSFMNLDLTFEGNNYSINGRNSFSGFIFNQDTQFNTIRMLNCRGQRYSASSFAGAIFNNAGELNVSNSAFIDNFVDSAGLNFGVAGAIYNLNDGEVNIDSTLFSGNHTNGASSYGGALANGYQSNTATMTINNSVFDNNYSSGSAIPYGGAIYNSGNIEIKNTLFNNNYAQGEDGSFIYGGTIYNIGNMNIDNSSINNSSVRGDDYSYAFGGAIFNNAALNINNTTISNNTADSDFYANGGAIYNNIDGVTTISNSTIENNRVSGNVQIGEGGGIYNGGKLYIDNSTFQNNLDKSGEKNDIYNASNAELEFNSGGTTSILSGISGLGTITKKDSGILNLGGINNNYTGNFNFEGGTVNLLANTTYFNAQNTSFSNGVNFNTQNGVIDNINFGNLNVSGTANIYPDVNLNTNTMDTISASSYSGGNLFVPNLAIEGVPKAPNISIPFADTVLKDYVQYNPTTLQTPIYNYRVSYDSGDGDFDFTRGGFNPSILSGEVAAQLGGYLTLLDTYKNIFSNLDMVMIMPPDEKISFDLKNKYASADRLVSLSPLVIPEQRSGIWFKPYSIFESVPLRHGPKVSNVSYGSIVGGESPLRELKNGWYNLYGGYASYNGSHQAYDGIGIYNNGGLIGADTVFYKGKFFSAWTASVGANVGEASSNFGRDEFGMLLAGVAEKTGYNFTIPNKKLIIQPSLLMSYSFVNTFNYHTASNVGINTEPLHAIHIEPQLKLIGNFKNFWQPYIAVSMVWNIIDQARFQADDVFLPDLSVKPFVQYGVGIQKRWGERLTGFLEAMIRNGGRQGIALQMGFRFSI